MQKATEIKKRQITNNYSRSLLVTHYTKAGTSAFYNRIPAFSAYETLRISSFITGLLHQNFLTLNEVETLIQTFE